MIAGAAGSIGSVEGPASHAQSREIRWAMGTAVAVCTLGGFLSRLNDGGTTRALVGGGIALVAGVWVVRAARRQVLAAAVTMTVGIAIIGSGTSSNVSWFTVCMLAGWCLLRGLRWGGLAYWLGVLVLFAGEWAFSTHDPGWAAWGAGTTFSALASQYNGHTMRLMAELRVAQAGLVDNARTEERNRIARELHDVIAHSLTVSLLHVTSARVALEYAPADAAAALAEAERIGRETLAEVRGTVGLLRDDGAVTGNRPQPGAADLGALVAGFRGAGADVDLQVTGDGNRVSDVAGLTIYRIAQEALTNAVRHAPGSPIQLRFSVAAQGISLVVESSGPARDGRGLGLVGMHERAAAVGGSCEAGPGGTGWVVRALIPA